MNKRYKIVVAIVIIALTIASFFIGSYVKEKQNENSRIERCITLIVFAIDKAEDEDLTDQGVMRALISNVYAAYQFCDNSIVANQLHDLWNYLIFESDNNIDAAKEIALHELNSALQSIKMAN